MFARRVVIPAGLALVLSAGVVALPAQSASPLTIQRPVKAVFAPKIRVDQLGYLSGEAKHARLMAAHQVDDGRFVVVDATGTVVLHGKVPSASTGRWNAHYKAVYNLSFSRLTTPGRYRLVTRGAAAARSPFFRIAPANALYGKLLRYGVKFDQVQRDGSDVIPGALDRKPAHLNDRHARVYHWPSFVPGSDTVTDKDLHRVRRRVDVAGGWADAGDYLKFTHSTAYNDVLLFLSQRMLGRKAPATVLPEARHGLAWLAKMWDAKRQVLYIQVGIGSSNQAGTFHGDHDKWRLPEADDHDSGRLDRYVSHRPVFQAAAPGASVSPNLAGRVSAAFALAAQVDAKQHPARARRELRQATLLYARADTDSPPKPLVTALPHAFYPEGTWRDDMELGAAEIALAARALGGNPRPYVRDAATWARDYIDREAGDTLNLYDTSALAHADLVRALTKTGMSGLAVNRADLIGDLRRQLEGALQKSRRDPFAAGGTYDNFDVNSHTFALIATAGIYHQLVGRSRFDAFSTTQRNWLLGGNPWGVSAMVGVGTRFPRCMQHQVANLSGAIDGSRPLDLGAVVNGPNAASIFSDGLGGFQDAMVKCPPPPGKQFRAFDGRHSRYVDDVRSWQTNEPALDMTGAAIIAAAAQLAIH
jgi:endoglucanase